MTNHNLFGIVYKSLREIHNEQLMWEHSSAGRASALQAEGHRFEPCCSHQNGPVVQLVRTLACHARGRRFEPVPGRHLKVKYADVAHLVERHLAKVEVASSSLVIRSIWYHSQVVRPRSAKPLFPSSNLGGTSKKREAWKSFSFFIQSEGLVCNRRQAYVISEAVWHHLGVCILRIDYIHFTQKMITSTPYGVIPFRLRRITYKASPWFHTALWAD